MSAHQPTVVSGLGCALALGAVLAAVAAGPALAKTPSKAATEIRQIDDSGAFTPPTPHAGFTVGTFNASTGAFTGTRDQRRANSHDPRALRRSNRQPGRWRRKHQRRDLRVPSRRQGKWH